MNISKHFSGRAASSIISIAAVLSLALSAGGCACKDGAKPAAAAAGADHAHDHDHGHATAARHPEFGVRAAASPSIPIAMYASLSGVIEAGKAVPVRLTVQTDAEVKLLGVDVSGIKGVRAERLSGPTAVHGQPGRYVLELRVKADEGVAGYATLLTRYDVGHGEQSHPFAFKYFAKGATVSTPPIGRIVRGDKGTKVQVMPASTP